MPSSDDRLADQFLVNGKRCNIVATQETLSWWPLKWNQIQAENKKEEKKQSKKNPFKQIHLAHVLAVKKQSISIAPVKEYDDNKSKQNLKLDHAFVLPKKIKIYYSKENLTRSNGQLLKLKKLIIQDLQLKTSDAEQVHSNDTPTKCDQSPIQAQNNQIAGLDSAPPSCYASEGSSNHLSSLSTSSSSSTACSPSPSPVGWPANDDRSIITSCDKLVNQSNESKKNQCSSKLVQLNQFLQAQIVRLRKFRPKRLLIFVNPYGGKGNALYLYDKKVKHLLDLAEIESTLVVTKYANHARDTIEDPMFKVEHFDGIVCVGGDGMFSELMNGLLFRYNRDIILNSRLAQKHSSIGSNKITDCKDNLSNSNQDEQNNVTNKVGKEKRDELLNIKTGGDGLEVNSSLARSIFRSPPVPIGVIGAGSTDANSYGLIGTNDVITATLNIILGYKIKIDACSIHAIDNDDLIKFVSTFVAYGYFGDVIRESEKLRWLGPSRYDVTGANNLIKNRTYRGTVRILVSKEDGLPTDSSRCSRECQLCWSQTGSGSTNMNNSAVGESMEVIERSGPFIGVNAAVTACRCPQTKKGFSPNNHLANGCADLILVRPCTRLQYIRYLLRTGWTKKSAFDLNYVEAFRCRQFEFISENSQLESRQVSHSISNQVYKSTGLNPTGGGQDRIKEEAQSDVNFEPRGPEELLSSWNVDGEVLNEQSIRVKVNNQLLIVFGTGEPHF